MVKKRYLEAGKIVGTHGVRGEVRVQPWCDTPAQFASLKVVYFDEAGTRPVSLSSRVHGNLCLSRLEGVDTMQDAAALRDKVLYLDRSELYGSQRCLPHAHGGTGDFDPRHSPGGGGNRYRRRRYAHPSDQRTAG